jgi:predicted CopG family antitoxin
LSLVKPTIYTEKPDEEVKMTTLTINVTAAVSAKVRRLSKDDGRSISNYINRMIEKIPEERVIIRKPVVEAEEIAEAAD